MKTLKLMFAGALLAAAPALVGCAYGDDGEQVGEAAEAVGPNGTNNVSPQAIDAQVLKRGITNSFGLTSSTNADPLQLCKNGTVTGSGCTLRPEWESWLSADPVRGWMMKGISKCATESTFAIQTSDGSLSFQGQWGLYPGWKSGRLTGQDKRERMSSCILTLLNGNNESLTICIIGPGGSPFSDACTDPSITSREAGFFGDLFAASPTAYVAGPDSNEVVTDGRACAATQGTYCCAEDDTSCAHHIVLAGAILGSPDQGFANKRCSSLAMSGDYQYCTSYFSTREPGRSYTNVFTTFVPPAL